MTSDLRKFLLISPVAGLVRFKHENNGYKIKINEKMVKRESLKWVNINILRIMIIILV